MKPVLIAGLRSMLLLVIAATSIVLTGCTSPDTENQASRPWGSPKGWEGGLPSSMTEGR